MRRELAQVPVPDADAAEQRARAVVVSAFAAQEPVPARRRPGRLAAALVAAVLAAIVAGAALSPPGRAVVERIREAVGVEDAERALFRLPAPGPLLIHAEDAAWIVRPDGSRRRLGAYREASWSPFGRYLVAARANELLALEPGGSTRWSLARRAPGHARWAGTQTDTTIAYVDRTGLRVVAGDGTGDRLLSPAEDGPLAWRPGARHELAYVEASEVRVQDTESGRVLWRGNRGLNFPVLALEWSTDGRRLLVVSAYALRVFDERGRVVAQDDPSDGTLEVDAAFRPGTHEVVAIRRHGSQSTVFHLRSGKPVFSGTGVFTELEWSPDGRWLLIGWETADQWVFVRPAAPRRIRAVAGISAQFDSRGFPRVEGWCCPG